MTLRLATLVTLLLTAGCSPLPPDTATEKVRHVLVPGYETPSTVLYQRADSNECLTTRNHARHIAVNPNGHEAFQGGYLQTRVRYANFDFRAFFRPNRLATMPNESAFIVCSEGSTPIGMFCSVVGHSRGGCFYTPYNWYKLAEIDSLVEEITRVAPAWGGT